MVMDLSPDMSLFEKRSLQEKDSSILLLRSRTEEAGDDDNDDMEEFEDVLPDNFGWMIAIASPVAGTMRSQSFPHMLNALCTCLLNC